MLILLLKPKKNQKISTKIKIKLQNKKTKKSKYNTLVKFIVTNKQKKCQPAASRLARQKKKSERKIKIKSKKTINKENYTKNGNIVNNISIATWNKGPSLYRNSVQDINIFLQNNPIDILALQELNLRTEDDKNLLTIPGYTLINDHLLNKNGLSRSGFLVSNKINYKLRPDLTRQKEAHTVITVYITKTKKFNCHSWYRQWQEIKYNKKIPDTGTVNSQIGRITDIAEKFKISKVENETIILSDTNINSLNLNTPEISKPQRDKQTNKVAQILSKSILQEGFAIVNKAPTHSTATIDHITTSDINKIITHRNIETHLSDHKLVLAQTSTKNPVNTPRYTSSRQYHKIDFLEMNQQINQDPRLTQAMQSNNPEDIAQNIIQVINDQLDSRAPIKRIQTTNKKAFTSDQTKELIEQRNFAWNLCAQFPSMDNKRDYKNIKNQVKKSIKNDKIKQDKNKITDAVNSRDQWKEAKKQIGWTHYGGPKTLVKMESQLPAHMKWQKH